jgi:hypothetical protein
MLDLSQSGNQSNFGHWRIYNNVFRWTAECGTVAIRMYTVGGTVSSFSDIHIDNNTFVDGSATTNSSGNFGAAISHGNASSATSLNCSFRNNIVYNCAGSSWDAIQADTVDDWDFSYNDINAGAHGNTRTGSWGAQSSGGRTLAPAFVSYAEYVLGNNYQLSISDVACINQGTNLAGFLQDDKIGVVRPQGASWDIGAYEYNSGTTNRPLITSPLVWTGTNGWLIEPYTITPTNEPSSYTAINLPTGLSRSGAVISGTPTVTGTTNSTITVTNAAGGDAQTLVWTIYDQPPRVPSRLTLNGNYILTPPSRL